MINFKKNKEILSRGFTAIEMTVVISIFAILSAVVLFNSGAFNSKVVFENLTSDIAINVLQAQKEALSGKLNGLGFGLNPPSYGINFSTTTNQKFTYFADLVPVSPYRNAAYDIGSGCGSNLTECLKEINIQTSDYVSSLCVNKKSSPPGTCVSDLSIVFTRPFPKPSITGSSLPPVPNNTTILDAEIVIMSPRNNNDTKTIVIWPTGEISVE